MVKFKKLKNKFKNPEREANYTKLGKYLVKAIESDNILVTNNWKKFISINFARGLFIGLGSVVGATVLVAVTLWLLNAFGALPLIGEWFDALGGTLEEGTSLEQ